MKRFSWSPLCVVLYGALCGIVFLTSCTHSVRFSSTARGTHSRTITKLPSNTSTTDNVDTSPLSLNDIQSIILRSAKERIGTPYCYGGNGTPCIDCSAFTQAIYQEAGITIPRTSKDQIFYGKPIYAHSLAPADLVFFDMNGSGTVNHVGVYVGNGEIIHASSSKGVIKQPLNDSYLGKRILGYRRMLKDIQ